MYSETAAYGHMEDKTKLLAKPLNNQMEHQKLWMLSCLLGKN